MDTLVKALQARLARYYSRNLKETYIYIVLRPVSRCWQPGWLQRGVFFRGISEILDFRTSDRRQQQSHRARNELMNTKCAFLIACGPHGDATRCSNVLRNGFFRNKMSSQQSLTAAPPLRNPSAQIHETRTLVGASNDDSPFNHGHSLPDRNLIVTAPWRVEPSCATSVGV